MKKLLLILLCLPLIGFGQKISKNEKWEDITKSIHEDIYQLSGHSSRVHNLVYYDNKRVKRIWLVPYEESNEYREFGKRYKIEFYKNGFMKSVEETDYIKFIGRWTEESVLDSLHYDSIQCNADGTNKYSDALVGLWGKKRHEELGSYYHNMFKLDSILSKNSNNIELKLSIILKYDEYLNRYYQILKKDDGFLSLRKEQYNWLKIRGNLITNTSQDLQKIDQQIILYKVRLHELIQKFLNPNLEDWRYQINIE